MARFENNARSKNVPGLIAPLLMATLSNTKHAVMCAYLIDSGDLQLNDVFFLKQCWENCGLLQDNPTVWSRICSQPSVCVSCSVFIYLTFMTLRQKGYLTRGRIHY